MATIEKDQSINFKASTDLSIKKLLNCHLKWISLLHLLHFADLNIYNDINQICCFFHSF